MARAKPDGPPCRRPIYSLPASRDLLATANRRYLEVLSALGDPRNGRNKLDRLLQAVRREGRSYPGFDFFGRATTSQPRVQDTDECKRVKRRVFSRRSPQPAHSAHGHPCERVVRSQLPNHARSVYVHPLRKQRRVPFKAPDGPDLSLCQETVHGNQVSTCGEGESPRKVRICAIKMGVRYLGRFSELGRVALDVARACISAKRARA